MSPLSRDPHGKFIDHGGALCAWLPVMLGSLYNRALESMLERAAEWCLCKAADEYDTAARYLRKSLQPDFPRICAQRAEKWYARRDALLECRRKLGEIQ